MVFQDSYQDFIGDVNDGYTPSGIEKYLINSPNQEYPKSVIQQPVEL